MCHRLLQTKEWALNVDLSPSSARVLRSLEQIIERYGKPAVTRCDNSPELLAGPIMVWAERNRITIINVKPGKSTQNAYVERFSRTARHEWLDLH